MLELVSRCVSNCEIGFDKDLANQTTDNKVANAMKFVYGRITDSKFSKKEKLSTVIGYLDNLNTEAYISMKDYNIMHSRLCAVIKCLMDKKYVDTTDHQLMVYLNVSASMRESNIKRDARENGLIQCNLVHCTIKCINYLNSAFGIMLNSIGLYEDVMF